MIESAKGKVDLNQVLIDNAAARKYTLFAPDGRMWETERLEVLLKVVLLMMKNDQTFLQYEAVNNA